MVIDMRSYLTSGNYADVFAVGGRAYKLFKSGPDVPPRQTKEGRRRVFESQCKAFRLAPLDPFLRCHTAEFHGVQILEDVIDADGKSIQGSYLLDCCYAIELFGVDEIDIKATDERVRGYEYINKALQRFQELGINTSDSSVFRHHDPERFKFIDIEMKDGH